MSALQTPSHRRILIIDDNPVIHSDFRKILCPERREPSTLADIENLLFDSTPAIVQPITFELDSAFQGQEGLDMVNRASAENRPYSMAFIDVRMPPGWDGVETTVQIWREHSDIQVVICTAYSDYNWDEIVSRTGRFDSLLILKKPFDNIEVQQMAHAMCEKWRLIQENRAQTRHLEQLIEERTAALRAALTDDPHFAI